MHGGLLVGDGLRGCCRKRDRRGVSLENDPHLNAHRLGTLYESNVSDKGSIFERRFVYLCFVFGSAKDDGVAMPDLVVLPR